MRCVCQIVSRAAVSVNGAPHAEIGRGMLLLVGVSVRDTENDAMRLAQRIAKLRIFPDEAGKLNLALCHPAVRGDLLVVSNFTLYADCAASRRPSFSGAASGNQAQSLFNCFLASLRLAFQNEADEHPDYGVPLIATGEFGADMQIDLVNDGPITLTYDTETF